MKKLVALITDQPPPEDEPKGAKGGEKKGGSRAAKKSAKGDCKFVQFILNINISYNNELTPFILMDYPMHIDTILPCSYQLSKSIVHEIKFDDIAVM